ncbi:unnamed protein product [Urochloa decumbens]|uniref:No apical meristem-associated C-terminal domain-containing protein n=1 Tax=Urochloa decumbens TaxID=240449 RepID=A0ABC9BK45_9POAL
MAGSEPDHAAAAPGRDGPSRTMPLLAGAPRGISGDGRPPRPAAATTTSKKRRSTFVAPTRPAAPRPGVVLPRQLFQAPPPAPRLPAPLSHQEPSAGRKAQTPSFSEPSQLLSHGRTASMTSMQDDASCFSSSSMPLYDFNPTPTAENILQYPMGSSESYVHLLTQDSEADLEVLTQAPIPDSGSSRGRGGNYTHNEDIQLCLSWMAITFDPRIGSDQSKDTYWNRIAQHYHVNKTFDSGRNATSLDKRWNTIQKECIRFQECIEKIERLRPSGVPHTDYINLAQKSYDETKGKRQSKPKESGKASSSQQEAHEDDRAPSKRPPGRKQSKQKQKMNEGDYEYALQFATFIQMKAEEHQKREERWKAEKELEERKLLWDQEQKIMFCDMSNIDESQRAYVMAMRQQIAAAKVASVKAYGGGSTSEQGSGGDAEEAESLM